MGWSTFTIYLNAIEVSVYAAFSKTTQLRVSKMADPGYVAGSLFQLARRLRRLYKRMRNASGEILNLRNRTKILAQTYEFFKDTMDNVGRLEELSHVFERHKKLLMGVDDESKRTINRLTQLYLIHFLAWLGLKVIGYALEC